MRQQQAPTTPPPPDIGQTIGDAIKGAVGGALQSAAAEVQAQLDAAVARRDAIQGQLDGSSNLSRSEQRALRAKLDEANAEVAKLTQAAAKLDASSNKLVTPGARAGRTYAGTAPAFPSGPGSPDYIPEQMIITIVGIIFIGFPLSIAFARLLWRRATNIGAPKSSTQMSVDQAQRFDRIEHAVDAVAIEVERISENQRYLTKVLAEGQEKKLTG